MWPLYDVVLLVPSEPSAALGWQAEGENVRMRISTFESEAVGTFGLGGGEFKYVPFDLDHTKLYILSILVRP